MNIYSVGKRIYLQHICYMTNILGLYFFPFLILIRKKDIKKILTSFFKNKINKFFLLIGILYISYFIFFADLTSTFNFGGGYSLKVTRFLFNIELYQKIFLSIIFFFLYYNSFNFYKYKLLDFDLHYLFFNIIFVNKSSNAWVPRSTCTSFLFNFC